MSVAAVGDFGDHKSSHRFHLLFKKPYIFNVFYVNDGNSIQVVYRR
jgi:hypothetical protein